MIGQSYRHSTNLHAIDCQSHVTSELNHVSPLNSRKQVPTVALTIAALMVCLEILIARSKSVNSSNCLSDSVCSSRPYITTHTCTAATNLLISSIPRPPLFPPVIILFVSSILFLRHSRRNPAQCRSDTSTTPFCATYHHVLLLTI